jgi:predicted RND superfamily exporter protein
VFRNRRLRVTLTKLLRAFLARPLWRLAVLGLALAVALPAGHAMMQLYANIRSDLEALLPADSPAVRGVQVLRERMEGSQHLGVVVRSARSGPPLQFASELGDRLRAYAEARPDLIQSVRTDVAAERQFLRRHGPLYIPLDDLRTIRNVIAAMVIGMPSPMAMFGGLPDPGAIVAQVSNIAQRRDPFAGRFPGDRLVAADGRMAVVLVFFAGTDTGMETIGPLVENIRQEVAALEPAQRGIEVGYAGDVAIAVEELSALKADIGISAALVLLGIVALIVRYFRWWGALPALAIPLAIGTAWGFGVASFFVSSLSGSTAFLGSIVAGNGINAGIILLARYMDERRRGAAPEDAILTAMQTTWLATLAATAAASVGYASLLTAAFRGFNEFAVINSIGMLACWGATYLLLPVTLLVLDRRAHVAERRPGLIAVAWNWISRLVVERPRAVMLVGGMLLLASLASVSQLSSSRIEYDMTRLRSRESAINGEAYWAQQMNSVLERNFTAVALMAETVEDAERLAPLLREAASRAPLAAITSAVVTSDDLLPPDLDQRSQVLREIRDVLTPAALAAFPGAVREQLEALAASADAPSPTAEDLPELLALGLREKDGQFGRTSLLLQSLDGSTWNGALTIESAAALRHLADRVQPAAEIAGGFFVSAEILETLQRVALPTTLLSFASVVVVVLIVFRGRVQSMVVLSTLLAGVALLFGAVMAFDLRINFLNFMAFPITFGNGVDYSVNMVQRYREDPSDIGLVVRQTGSAVVLCSFTTILGYGSLIQASNQALFSLGVLAVLGEFTCLLSAVLLLPAVLSAAGGPVRRISRS